MAHDVEDPFNDLNEFAEAIALYKGPRQTSNVKAIHRLVAQALVWCDARGIDLAEVVNDENARRAS